MEVRLGRLRTRVRVTYAFHAREVRFERDAGEGPERLFPETFSFHANRHDPAELYFRLEDLWTNPGRLAPAATRREAEDLVRRLVVALPEPLEATLERLEGAPGAEGAHLRVCEDVAVFGQVLLRFVADRGLERDPAVQLAGFHLRRVTFRALLGVMEARVSADFRAEWLAGRARAETAVEDPTGLAFFHAIASGRSETIDRSVTGAAERAYRRWLEEVCLDETNDAFERTDSPFEEREAEVLRAVAADGRGPVTRGRELSPFLRQLRSRDGLRLLEKLERWFLRQYDVGHASAVIHHAARIAEGRDDAREVLSRHSTRSYLLALGIPALPFLGAAFAYPRAPAVFDWLVSAEVALGMAVAFWFLIYRFMWRRDLTFFHASVPRIGAGIIVGYLPVFLIDEVWDLAEQSPFYLVSVVTLLGSTTLLYIYVEVQRRLGDSRVSFARALDIFLLGLVQAFGFGLVVTSLLGPLMAVRNWGEGPSADTLAGLRESAPPFVGELPLVMGVEPLPAFPTAVVLMAFLAFFIGTFLQLLWEDLPITEPL